MVEDCLMRCVEDSPPFKFRERKKVGTSTIKVRERKEEREENVLYCLYREVLAKILEN